MVFTTVITHATGDVFPAADWNTYIRDNINYLQQNASGQPTLILNGTVSYTAPTSVADLLVEGIGGGGGGGGAVATGAGQAAMGGGGGGGSYARKLISSNIGTHVVAVGAGGTGGVGATSGTNGGNTQFNNSVGTTVMQAIGGSVGDNGGAVTPPMATAAGAAGGAAGTGDVTLAGGNGHPGLALSATQNGIGGGGGHGARGGAGGLATRSVGSNGNGAPSAGGGGGSGAANGQSATTKTGGAGANGILYITAFG